LKKIIVLTASILFVLALATSALAGIRNTVHDFQSGVAGGNTIGFGGTTAQRGMCSYCHIPHSSKGDRLWPSPGGVAGVGGLTVAAGTARTGIVGVLCASCHDTATNTGNTHSPMYSRNGQDRSLDIYATWMINHVLIDDGVYANNTNQNYVGTSAQFTQANTWPYCGTQGVGGGTPQQIECSSCHNPHSEAYGQSTITVEAANGILGFGNDYLRSSFYNTSTGVAFCEYCHEEKTRGGLAGNTIGTGTHPVGTTANAGDAAQADIHIESAERAGLVASHIVNGTTATNFQQYDMGIGTGSGTGTYAAASDNGIGTHLTSYTTGGVTCQTCHKVHGAPPGAGNSWGRGATTFGSYLGNASRVYLGASDDHDCNLLAVENNANGGTAGYTYPTSGRTGANNAGDYNDLCIDCHETTPSVGANWLASGDSPTNTGADSAVAGQLANDAHPVNIAPDGLSESGFDLTVQDPTWKTDNGNWTDAKWAGATATPRDYSMTSTGRWNGNAAAAANSEIICLTCHSIHDGENGTPILRAKSKTYCEDCHTASVGTVSHPVGYGSAMRDNPDGAVWPNGDNLPLADYYMGTSGSFKHTNGDTTTDMACFTCHAAHDGVDSFLLRVKDDNSRICVGCHTDFIATFATSKTENPSNYIAEYGEGAATRLGSHYTGTVNDTANAGETRWTYSGVWTDTIVGTSTKAQTSHWAGATVGQGGSNGTRTNLRMQCQSCHTPHNAATGLVEANSYDGSITPLDFNGATAGVNTNYDGSTATKMAFTPTTALLLGSNQSSKICATCHWPSGTHVTTIYSVPAKPDPARVSGFKRKYRDYCTRTEKYIISILNGEQEYRYNVYDLIADGKVTDAAFTYDGRTPESPCNFPPLMPGVAGGTARDFNFGTSNAEMLCDSCLLLTVPLVAQGHSFWKLVLVRKQVQAC